MFNASDGLIIASAAVLTEMLKQMPHEKALAPMGNAATALEQGRNTTQSTIWAVRFIRGDWLKAI